MKFAGLAVAFVLFPTVAFANQAAADACAAKLPKDSAAIYTAAAPQAVSGGNLKDIVTKVTRGMVLSGKLSRSDARPAAEAAGTCLALLKN
jgi:hypothetical protein